MPTIKNTFLNGLVLDFAPTATPNTVLTDALNATLVTYNGNEMSLQNDMGNGRVETAYLPKGYIPVGSCEFGGIIYIVSYNPLENKSLIGCFPSPERNIASDEISDLNITLSGSELVDTTKHTIIKDKIQKIIYLNDVSSGDKFIISWEDSGATNHTFTDGNYITNVGLTDTAEEWPKLVRIRLVSIEESGKIVELDLDLKYYTNTTTNSEYFIKEGLIESNSNADLDNYRDAISCNYDVFKSKVSGKLALLVELEKIDTFSAAVSMMRTSSSAYPFINVGLSWTSRNKDINPKGFVWWAGSEKLTDFSDETKYTYINCNNTCSVDDITDFSTYKSKGLLFKNVADYTDTITLVWEDGMPKQNNSINVYLKKDSTQISLNDDVVVQLFEKLVFKYITSPTLTNTTDPVTNANYYTFSIAPAMDYGVLTDMTLTFLVDLSATESSPNINTWQYYNTYSTSTLTWGYNYQSEDVRIKEVVFDFYDNRGLVGSFSAPEYESFNGLFTTNIMLNLISTYLNNPPSGTTRTDFGKLVYGLVYLVKITTKLYDYDINTSLYKTSHSTLTDWRWLWTTTLFNDYYDGSVAIDFNSLEPPELSLIPLATFDGAKLHEDTSLYYNAANTTNFSSAKYKTLGAEIKHVGFRLYVSALTTAVRTNFTPTNVSLLPNLTLTIEPCLSADLGLSFNTNKLNNIAYSLSIGDKTITYDSSFSYDFTKSEVDVQDMIIPIAAVDSTDNTVDDTYSVPTRLATALASTSTIVSSAENANIYDEGLYTNFKDWFNLSITSATSLSGDTAYSTGFKLLLRGVNYSKLYADSGKYDSGSLHLESIIATKSKALKNNLILYTDLVSLKALKDDLILYTRVYNSENLTVDSALNLRFNTSYFLIYGYDWENSETVLKLSTNSSSIYTSETSLYTGSFMNINSITTIGNPGYTFAPIYYMPFAYWSGSRFYMWSKSESDSANSGYSIDHMKVSNYIDESKSGTAYSVSDYIIKTGQTIDTSEEGINELVPVEELRQIRYVPITLGIIDKPVIYPTADAGLVKIHSLYPSSDNTGAAIQTKDVSAGNSNAEALHTILSSSSNIPLSFTWASGYNDAYPKSYALLVGSILGQIYTPTTSVTKYLYNNIVTIEPYTTQWKANVDLTWTINSTDHNDLLCIGGSIDGTSTKAELSSYLTKVISAATAIESDSDNDDEVVEAITDDNSAINRNNVTFTIADSLDSFPMQYNPTYSVDNIMEDYNLMSQSTNEVVDFTNNATTVLSTSDVSRGGLYTLEGSDLVELSDSSTFALLNSFAANSNDYLYASVTDDVVSSRIPVDAISVKNEVLNIDTSQISGYDSYYRLYFDSTNSSNVHLNNVPKIHLFNYTSICQ